MTDDLISRKAAIDAVIANAPHGLREKSATLEAIHTLHGVPAVDLSAKWLEYDVDECGNVYVWKCSECGEEVETKWNYCPVCGSKMVNA